MKAHYAFVQAHQSEFPVVRMCQALGVARSGYYTWRQRPESPHAREDRQLLQQIRQIHETNHEVYGSPRIHNELQKTGIRCARKRVARLMREARLRSKQARRFRVTTQSKHRFPVAENLLNREFTVAGPNQAWVGDITYIETDEGWLYLAVLLDLFSRWVVGWAMDSHMRASLAHDALEQAVAWRKPAPGLTHHTDQGVQYACTSYQERLQELGFQVSMSRKGNCWDNAPAESFFKSLKTEQVYHQRYRTRAEAKSSIFAYLEGFYNRRRRHSTLGYESPAAFEATAESQKKEKTNPTPSDAPASRFRGTTGVESP